MRSFNLLAAAATIAAPLLGGAAPSLAATASNSQAGAWGHNKNSCKPTPYFQQGGCLTSFFTGQDDGWVPARPEVEGRDAYRPRLRSFDE